MEKPSQKDADSSVDEEEQEDSSGKSSYMQQDFQGADTGLKVLNQLFFYQHHE